MIKVSGRFRLNERPSESPPIPGIFGSRWHGPGNIGGTRMDALPEMLVDGMKVLMMLVEVILAGIGSRAGEYEDFAVSRHLLEGRWRWKAENGGVWVG